MTTPERVPLYQKKLVPEVQATLELMAQSESIDWYDLRFLFNYLLKKEMVEKSSRAGKVDEGGGITKVSYKLTIPGFTRVAELEQVKNEASDRAFVAMCFNSSFDDVWKKGIEPAVEAAGYKPVRVDKEEHLDLIPDKIISEIRQSRFVVADFSYCKKDSFDDKRASEGVYYEAGFAYGLDIPVIFTCKDSDTDGVHFDIDQYNRIQWKDPEDLKARLKERYTGGYREGSSCKNLTI